MGSFVVLSHKDLNETGTQFKKTRVGWNLGLFVCRGFYVWTDEWYLCIMMPFYNHFYMAVSRLLLCKEHGRLPPCNYGHVMVLVARG